MTWTRTPQEYPDRADVLAVSRSARWLLMECYSWSNAQLTNGRVPRSILRRISDAEDVAADVAELLREGLMEEPEPGFLFLDWSNQEAADTVQARAARNAEKTKRSRERKERHLGGDHSMCVAPYCKLGNVTGNDTGNQEVTSPVTKKSRNGKLTDGVTPLQSSPVQSVRSKGLELDRERGQDSAGATSGRVGPGGGLNAQTATVRRFQGVDVTPDMTGGRDPHTLDEFQLEAALADHFYPETDAHPADTLDGLVAVGGADA